MKKVVYLQVYLGKEILYKQGGKVSNQNQEVTLEYPTQEWDNYMKHLSVSGFCKVDISRVREINVNNGVYTYKECDDFEDIKVLVKKHHINKLEKPLSKEQIEINELKKQVQALLKVNSTDVKSGNDDELEDLKKKYEAKFNKKPHHMMGIKKLKEELTK